MVKPIFYDPTGKRQKRSLIGLLALIGVAVFIFLSLLVSKVIAPDPAGNHSLTSASQCRKSKYFSLLCTVG